VSRVAFALLLRLVALGAVAGAEDEEQLLETPPPQGIPERLQDLEREWADDVGAKDPDAEPPPEPSPVDEAHEAPRGTDEAPASEPPPPGPADESVPPKKSSPLLPSPIGRTTPERPNVRGMPPVQPSPIGRTTPERPNVRGMPPSPLREGTAEAPARAPARPATTAVE
jgi:hypothetical protein